MTIYEIKRLSEATSPFFFTRKTLKFFNQKMKDFSVCKYEKDGVKGYLISAPSYWDNRLMGYTRRFFNPITNELEHIK